MPGSDFHPLPSEIIVYFCLSHPEFVKPYDQGGGSWHRTNSSENLPRIFSANVAGYSRLMAEDEAATVKTLEQYKQVMSELIRQHRGRVIDSPGDNLLAEVTSVVDAVQCAVAT